MNTVEKLRARIGVEQLEQRDCPAVATLPVAGFGFELAQANGLLSRQASFLSQEGPRARLETLGVLQDTRAALGVQRPSWGGNWCQDEASPRVSIRGQIREQLQGIRADSRFLNRIGEGREALQTVLEGNNRLFDLIAGQTTAQPLPGRPY